jgi:glyoxylase-like metal-dependent hydrolase (beta-lactamase superfamily II)
MAVARDFLRVTAGICSWQAYEPEVKCDLSSCALATCDGLILVDPIGLAEDAFARMSSGVPPCAIVLTNGNHARAAASYRERFGTKVFASADAAGLELTPDATLADGDFGPGGLRVVAMPGAGPGEIALLGNGVAVIGDALINLAPEGFRRLPAKYCTDPGRLEDSLRKLLSYEFDVMTFAHGAPLVGEARRSLELLLA